MLTFLILSGALTLIACLSILLPFIRQESGDKRDMRDIDVYRQQLAELDAEEQRGLIGPKEAIEARAELGRRILRASENRQGGKAPSTAGRWIVVLAVAAIPVVSGALYLVAGTPGMPDLPLAMRTQGGEIERLIAQTEQHLAANPDDGRGWSVLAPVYQRLGRHREAAAAWRKAIELLGPDAARMAELGESLVSGDGGRVTPEAREWFEKALELAPEQEKARFFVALADAQAGRLEEAEAGWNMLIANAEADSPWPEIARQALAELGRMRGGTDGGEGSGGLQADAEQMQMIEGMVSSLAAKLEENPQDIAGWERLIRSYIVLDRRDDAAGAMSRARETFADHADAMARLDVLAQEFGL